MTGSDALDTSLNELVALLEQHDEEHWARGLVQQERLVAAGDAHGLDGLMSMFGGMGSLTDLVIHPMNGHDVAEEDATRVNERLRALTDHVIEQATALRHAARRES